MANAVDPIRRSRDSVESTPSAGSRVGSKRPGPPGGGSEGPAKKSRGDEEEEADDEEEEDDDELDNGSDACSSDYGYGDDASIDEAWHKGYEKTEGERKAIVLGRPILKDNDEVRAVEEDIQDCQRLNVLTDGKPGAWAQQVEDLNFAVKIGDLIIQGGDFVLVNNFMQKDGKLVKQPEGLFNSAWVAIVLDFSTRAIQHAEDEAEYPEFNEEGKPDGAIRWLRYQWVSKYEEVERVTRGSVENHEYFRWPDGTARQTFIDVGQDMSPNQRALTSEPEWLDTASFLGVLRSQHVGDRADTARKIYVDFSGPYFKVQSTRREVQQHLWQWRGKGKNRRKVLVPRPVITDEFTAQAYLRVPAVAKGWRPRGWLVEQAGEEKARYWLSKRFARRGVDVREGEFSDDGAGLGENIVIGNPENGPSDDEDA